MEQITPKIRSLVEETVRAELIAYFKSAPQKELPAILYGVEGLAKFLGLSKLRALQLMQDGRIPYLKAGNKKYLFLVDEVIEAIRPKE